MALTKYTGAINTIQNLSDRPNQSEGLTAAQLKLKFDKSAIDTQTYIDGTLTVEIDTLDAENVKKTGNQNIAGVKTFSSSPIVPTPTEDMEAATKKYIDDVGANKTSDLNTHKISNDHDGRYYTESEINALLAAKTNLTGNHEGTWQGYSPTQTDPGIQAVVNSHTTQLEDMMNSSKMSALGITSDTTDQSSNLISAFTDIKAKGNKIAYFDLPLNLDIENTLTGAENIFLYGKAKINKSHLNNVFINVIDKINTNFNGKINKCAKQEESFKQFKLACNSGKNIKVTIWGDSISTSYDMLGINSANPSGKEVSPDGLTRGSTYSSYLIDELTNKFSNKTFDFYNRAIGGETIFNWNNNKEFNGVTKPWIEHIKDTEPDLLVIGFGMNHNTIDLSTPFASRLKQVMDYIKANFTKIPCVAFVTTPRSAYKLGLANYGDYNSQISRQNTANILRNVAEKYNAYVIDVNRLSNIKRIGCDYITPVFKKIENLSDFLEGNYTSITGGYKLSTEGQKIKIAKYIKDFSIKFTATFANGQAGDSLKINYNKVASLQFYENTLSIYPTESGTTVYNSLTAICDYVTWGNGGLTKTVTQVGNTSTSVYRLEKRGNIIKLFKGLDGEELVMIDKAEVLDTHGFIEIYKGGIGTTEISITDLVFCEGEYEKYMPTLTEQEMYGEYLVGDSSTKSPYGGNGVNHPSSLGLINCYVPCIKEFVADLSLPIDFNSLGLFPLQTTINLENAETTFSFYNTVANEFGVDTIGLKNPSGARFTRNFNVKSYSDKALLGGTEYGIYPVSGNRYQILVNNSDPLNGWTLQGFYNV